MLNGRSTNDIKNRYNALKRAQKRTECDNNFNELSSEQFYAIPTDSTSVSPYCYFNNDYYQDDESSSISTPTQSCKSFNSASSYDSEDSESTRYETNADFEDMISNLNHYEEILNYLAYELN